MNYRTFITLHCHFVGLVIIEIVWRRVCASIQIWTTVYIRKYVRGSNIRVWALKIHLYADKSSLNEDHTEELYRLLFSRGKKFALTQPLSQISRSFSPREHIYLYGRFLFKWLVFLLSWQTPCVWHLPSSFSMVTVVIRVAPSVPRVRASSVAVNVSSPSLIASSARSMRHVPVARPAGKETTLAGSPWGRATKSDPSKATSESRSEWVNSVWVKRGN